jgi:hypothetical protein
MTPEGRIKEKVKRRFKEIFGNDAYRFMPVQNGMGSPSVDFLYCVRGLFVGIETKAPGKLPTPRQRVTLNEITAAGGLVYVVDSSETLEIAIANIAMALKYAPRAAPEIWQDYHRTGEAT